MSDMTLYSTLKNIANIIKSKQGISETDYDENKIKPKDFYNNILLLSSHTLSPNMVDDDGNGLPVLKHLTISGSIANGEILTGAFASTSIISVSFEEGIKVIKSQAFSMCSKLSELNTGVVEKIEYSAFEYCTGLKKLNVSKNTTSISSSSFFGCSGLTDIIVDGDNPIYDSRDDCKAIMTKEDVFDSTGNLSVAKNTLICGCKNTIIPEGTVALAGSCFGSKDVTTINLPSSVKSIGNYCFQNSYSLTTINLENVENIGSGSFVQCSALTNVDLSNIKSVGSSGFAGCTKIVSVNTNNLSNWCGVSFNGYQSTPIYYSRELKVNEEVISQLTIPDEVTKISSYAFGYCENITSVEFPANISSLGSYAFVACSNCLEYDFSKTEGKIPTITTTTFAGTHPGEWKIKVPKSRLDEWKSATNWAALPEDVIIGV